MCACRHTALAYISALACFTPPILPFAMMDIKRHAMIGVNLGGCDVARLK